MTTTDQSGGNMLDAKTSSYAVAYGVTAIFNAIVVMLKETIPAVHDTMAAILGHHWIAHGVLDLIVFFLVGILLARRNYQISGATAVNYLIWGTVIGGGLIPAFFLIMG